MGEVHRDEDSPIRRFFTVTHIPCNLNFIYFLSVSPCLTTNNDTKDEKTDFNFCCENRLFSPPLPSSLSQIQKNSLFNQNSICQFVNAPNIFQTDVNNSTEKKNCNWQWGKTPFSNNKRNNRRKQNDKI